MSISTLVSESFATVFTMSWYQWPVLVSPTAGRRVHVGAANTASNDLYVDVVIAEGFWFELEGFC